ncbi:storkhead-box protein 1 [Heptranchias perlo]|uniref:storkhead-box protein 1 n=1 Tax=Heptranchias perlo TaxID=212740 RepID=UPI00355A3C22
MTPIAQSQFVPLAEVLCCVISEMNVSHILVTQEALMEYLVKCYPGIATPSQEILHSALGSLIQDRKIYHTGEGYFIVTPHTYFITGNMVKESHPWVSPEDRPPSLPHVTYLVSVESCEDPENEKGPPGAAHCKSCRCFSQQETEQQPGQWLPSEPGGLGQGSCREPRPSVQHRAISASIGHQESELSKVKEKENPIRRFGLSLFRRNTKKENPKRVYGTFSAQFPPEEWPVRDEASSGNIPRDVEHQLIKRINPGLTVDNLVRHTLLMKKLSKEKTTQCHSTSTERLASKQRHRSKVGPQKVPARPQHQRRARSGREKQRLKRRVSVQASEGVPRPGGRPRAKEVVKPTTSDEEQQLSGGLKTQPCRSGTPTKHVYKKRIENPFSVVPSREAPSVKHRRSQNTRCKSARSEAGGRVGRRSESLDSPRADGAHSMGESHLEKIQPNPVTSPSHYLRPGQEDSVGHSESRAIRMEHRHRVSYTTHILPTGSQAQHHPSKSQIPVSPAGDHTSNHMHPSIQSAERVRQERERTQRAHVLRQEVSHKCGNGPLPQSWQDQAPKQGQIAAVPTTVKPESAERLPNQPHRSSTQLMPQEQANEPETEGVQRETFTERVQRETFTEGVQRETFTGGVQSETFTDGVQSETFTDDDQTLYQRELDEDDAGSSLYLNDDAEITQCSQLSTPLSGHGCADDPDWHRPGIEGVPAGLSNESWVLTKILLEEQRASNTDFGEKQMAGWSEGNSSSPGQSKSWYGNEPYTHLHRHRPTSQLVYEHVEEEEEGHPGGCREAPVLLASSIFDYCNTMDGDSDLDSLRDPSSEGSRNPAGQEAWAVHQEMKVELMRNLERNLGFLHHSHNAALTQARREDHGHLETMENHSITGDSGIDSPRTRVSLASNNSIVLDSLKRRSLMQNFGTLSSPGRSGALCQHPLLQLTPVMNV